MRKVGIKKAAHEPLLQIKRLAMTYVHMGKPHTIIGAGLFHG
jgi:hypothetical protein